MFNPVIASKNIKEEFISYISTSFQFADEELRKQLLFELNEIISSGPWLETNDNFKSGLSIGELIKEGILSSLFNDLEAGKPNHKLYDRRLPIQRPLYLHQETAIKAIVAGHNVVISTGTGSGKTNCFLIPIINELLREIEHGTLGPGIRALIIYPMNALANDQMKNIRKLLLEYPSITFGVYNGGTENNEEEAIALYEAMFDSEPIPKLRHRLKNELLSREEMKENPPNILMTNYAMLEHLLFRPKDDVLFSRSDFKYVVLDEAHVYSGATGIETSILLRRLRARISSTRETQFILTSATLGNSSENMDDIVTFANNLCGVTFQKEYIIKATREKHVFLENTKIYPDSLICELASRENKVPNILSKYGINFEDGKTDKELLFDFALSSTLYQLFRKKVSKITSIEDIQSLLNLDIDTTIAFISICTQAQKHNKSLIDARYHFFVRSLEGCFLTLSPDQQLFLTRKKQVIVNDEAYAVFEVALCDECGKYSLVGKKENNHLVHSAKISDEVDFYFFAEEENDEIEAEEELNGADKFILCPHCGALVAEDETKHMPCDCNKVDYIKVVKAHALTHSARCGNCHIGSYKRFYLGNDAATSVLATALYEELPELIYEEVSGEPRIQNIFSRYISADSMKAKRVVRQFLAFSDSRQEAAKFACYLERSYEEFLRRRGIYQIIKQEKDDIISRVFTISDLVIKLTHYFSNNRSFAQSHIDNRDLTSVSKKNAWVAILNELARSNSANSLTSLGLLQFRYLGNTSNVVTNVAENYNVSEDATKNLLDLLILEIVKKGAICTDNDTDIGDNDRNYIFYTPSQKFITKTQLPQNRKTTVSDWLPRGRQGKPDEFHKSNILYYVKKYLNIDNKKAIEFLDQYFDYLTKYEHGNPYLLIDKNKNGTYVLPARHFQVKIAGDQSIKWYKCTKCGRVSPFNVNGSCTSVRCEAKVIEIHHDQLSKDNHFANLYFSDKMSPLFIKEHTAQLSKKESAEYQEKFIKKEINALSCSTTFEMGVDVGDLETVFLRDVPPLPSNYAQRAGRAGRSINAVAYALTFAKLSSHDLSFYKEPKKMINGVILPPLFKIDNEKIVRRHIYAVALSMFFADNPELYNGNKADKFINDKGYVFFLEWLKTKPVDLRKMLIRSIPDVDYLHARLGINEFGWLDDFCGQEGVFTVLIREYENNVKEFGNLIKKFKREDDLDKAQKCERKLKSYQSNKLIDFLARGNILPRYGFPVDTVELEQNTTATNVKRLRLSRDLQIAIAEYAPSSEIVADGKLYTSRYIKKSNLGNDRHEWHTAYIGVCNNPSCQAVNFSVTPISSEGVKCSSCGKLLTKHDFYESIEPRSGFVTEREAKDVPLTRQEKNYKSDDYYIGNTESKTIESHSFKFNGKTITVESTTNDSLMVKSASSFYVCPKCGYAIAEDERIENDRKGNKDIIQGAHKIVTTEKHESLFGQYSCDCQELVKYSLHHKFNTDVSKISFACDTSDYKTMISTMYALLYAISFDLNIERRDIKGCLTFKSIDHKSSLSIIIYDAVPGGAGHSRRLVTSDGMMLYNIIKSAIRNMENCQCDPSCYNCLRSYENQKIHENLDRKLAANFLNQFIGDVVAINDK